MAADEDDQDAVRRILQDRPPEKLPTGARARLKKRLDAEAAAAPTPTARPVRKPVAVRKASKKKTPRSRLVAAATTAQNGESSASRR